MNRAPVWLVNATGESSALSIVCEQARKAGQVIHVLHRDRDRERALESVASGEEWIHLVELDPDGFDFSVPGFEDDADILFLPCVEGIDWTSLRRQAPPSHANAILPLVPAPHKLDPLHFLTSPVKWFGWRARGELARRILREPSAWQANGLELVEAMQHWPDPPRWHSIPLEAPGSGNYPLGTSPRMTMASSVLVVIPFRGCEQWLNACLTSINQQTLPPENIVVVDDCSPTLPMELIEPFPNVTLLSTTRNVGPEKILNNIIFATDYDAYMVQDPDDWSSHDRLELSLRAAERTGADLVGTHEFTIHHPKGNLELCVYPPDVNRAMSQNVAHHLLHCTSLISRALALEIGGFDGNLKLTADTDFAVRACHAHRIINLPGFCVFHRVRAGSLTQHADTGYRSVARTIEAKFVFVRGERNLVLARSGQTPGVVAKKREAFDFIYHHGPKLRFAAGTPDAGTKAD